MSQLITDLNQLTPKRLTDYCVNYGLAFNRGIKEYTLDNLHHKLLNY